MTAEQIIILELKDELNKLRENTISLEAHELLIDEAKKDTAREVLQTIIKRHGHSCSEYYPTLIECNSIDLDKIAEEYGIELKDGE